MCGIAGFSLNQNSKINARSLTHHLLAQIELRGSHASGFAYKTEVGGLEVYKDKVAGSNLPIFGMPRNTKTAIMHTRFATHGSVNDNRNNHPVMSPTENIALVHNGVIWNQQRLRNGILNGVSLPDVDTSVIPALIEQGGTDALQELMGDAAIAWLDNSGDNTLHVARVEGNPINWTMLYDGSIVFASTQSLLHNALAAMDLKHGVIFELSELDYYKFDSGVLTSIKTLPATNGWGTGVASSYRGATAGGHSTATTTSTAKTTQTTRSSGVRDAVINGVHRVWDSATKSWKDYEATTGAQVETDAEKIEGALESIRAKYGNVTDKPMALESTIIPKGSENMWSMLDDEDDEDDLPLTIPAESEGAQFYTIDRDDNMATYKDLDELETTLLFHASRIISEDALGEQETKWVNYFQDLGSFGWAEDEMISWVKEPGQIAFFDTDSNDGLTYVRDGVDIIKQMVGR